MSDYWHAVSRAALGLPGSAEPRLRSLFEADDLATQATIETVDEEVDAQLPRAQPRRSEPAPHDAAQMAQPPAPPREPAPPAPPQAAAPAPAPPRVEIHTVRTETAPPQQDRAARAPAPHASGETERAETAQPTRQAHATPAPASERRRDVEDDAQPTASAPPAQHDMPARTETVTRADAAAAPPDDAPVAARLVEPPDIVVPDAVAAERESEPLVIEIGRIDIRIASETPPPAVAPRRRDSKVPLSLDDYLAQRSRAGR